MIITAGHAPIVMQPIFGKGTTHATGLPAVPRTQSPPETPPIAKILLLLVSMNFPPTGGPTVNMVFFEQGQKNVLVTPPKSGPP